MDLEFSVEEWSDIKADFHRLNRKCYEHQQPFFMANVSSAEYCAVARNGGVIIGMVLGLVHPNHPNEYVILAIVDPEHHMKGIGTGLVRKAIEELGNKRKGCVLKAETQQGYAGEKILQRTGFSLVDEEEYDKERGLIRRFYERHI